MQAKYICLFTIIFSLVYTQNIDIKKDSIKSQIESLKHERENIQEKDERILTEIDSLESELSLLINSTNYNTSFSVKTSLPASLRSKPTGGQNFIGDIPKNAIITIFPEYYDNYYKIQYNQKLGYINKMYISEITIELTVLLNESEIAQKLSSQTEERRSKKISNRKKQMEKENRDLQIKEQLKKADQIIIAKKKRSIVPNISKNYNKNIQLLYDSGLLKKFNVDANEAWVDPYLWNQISYDSKLGIGITLAKICDNAGSTGRITFINHYSGAKIARYSQSYGFKVY